MTQTEALDRLLDSQAPAMQAVVQTLRKVASVKLPVLITGPSGSGKTQLAKALHHISNRGAGPLIVLDCAGVQDALLESELFGHVQGAFTSAHKDTKGVFERASGGTLILDEISAASPSMQVALLRAVERQEITPLGAIDPIPVDVRVIATTSKDLTQEMDAGTFRSDLYYRLAVVTTKVPSLDERRADIPAIADNLLEDIAKTWSHLPRRRLSAEALQRLGSRRWPGGIRELENVLKRAAVLADTDEIRPELIEAGEPIEDAPLPTETWHFGQNIAVRLDHWSLRELSAELEEMMIDRALEKTEGNQSKAAKLLEISLRNLVYKLSAKRKQS